MAAFHAARVSNQSVEVWSQLGESWVKRRLGGAWNAEKEAFAKELAKELPPLECPEGSAWLNLRMLREAKPQGSDLEPRLEALTLAGSRSSLAPEIIPEVIRTTEKQWEDPERRAVGLGRLTEAAFGTPSQSQLENSYHEALKKVPPNRLSHVRRKLADAGALQLLCKSFCADVLPWTAEESPSRLQRWYDTVFAQCPPMLDAALQVTASLVQDPRQREQAWPLAEEIIFKHGGRVAPSPGLVTLTNAVAASLPLAPLQTKWDVVLLSPAAGLAQDTQSRVRVLVFMRRVKQSAAQESWSPAAFPADEPVWRNDVSTLSALERRQLVTWCAALFSECGITQPDDARGLVAMLAAAGEGSPSTVAAAVERLLDGRDPVTVVLVATAFATCALEEPGLEFWTQATKAVVDRCDRDKRQLFVAHLRQRFGRRDPQDEQRQETLLIALGLATAKSALSPEQAASEAPAEQKTTADLSGVQQISARFKEKLKWGQSLAAGKQSPDKSTESKKG